MSDLRKITREALLQEETGWNMGSFGAIAEFHHVAGDPPPDPADDLTQITSRGGIRIDDLNNVTPIAYETLSPKAHRWTQAISLCLPTDMAVMNQRDVLTELGPDTDAIRAENRDEILFDMGLKQFQVDFCIRTGDRDLLTLLREHTGTSLFDPANPAMPAILAAHPHRVALTRIGRVEVFQMIGGPDTGGKSPEGPHTHVLPKLLRAGRTHSANTPIPNGLTPCGALHPENPVIGRLGEDKPFNRAAFDAFQNILNTWAPKDYLTGKQEAWRLLAQGAPSADVTEPKSRTGRAGWRNGIRQWRILHGNSALVDDWSIAFDREAGLSEPENPGHEQND